MEEYALYAAKNILSIRKSQQDAKLDRDLQNATKNKTIEPDVFNGNDSNDDNIEEDLEEGDGENLDLPTANSYSHAVAMTRKHWKERDATDCLESSLLSHLHHSLRIADDAGMGTARPFFYDLNLLDSSSANSLELGVRTGISTDTTNIWKNLHRTALTEDSTDVNVKVGNHPNIIHNSDKSPASREALIFTISKGHIPKSEMAHFLEMLSPNSNSKAVCDQIYLLLPLNQLQH